MPDGSTYYGTLVSVIPTDPATEGDNASPDLTRPGSFAEGENALSKERLSVLRANSRLVDQAEIEGMEEEDRARVKLVRHGHGV